MKFVNLYTPYATMEGGDACVAVVRVIENPDGKVPEAIMWRGRLFVCKGVTHIEVGWIGIDESKPDLCNFEFRNEAGQTHCGRFLNHEGSHSWYNDCGVCAGEAGVHAKDCPVVKCSSGNI